MGEAMKSKITAQDLNAIIALVRRAPLQNLAEAEAAAALLNKFVDHFSRKPKREAK